MTDATIQAIIAGAPATIAALAGLLVSLRNGAKADVIVGHVNSAATKASGDIAALRSEVAMLRQAASETKETAALLAQAAVRPSKEAE